MSSHYRADGTRAQSSDDAVIDVQYESTGSVEGWYWKFTHEFWHEARGPFNDRQRDPVLQNRAGRLLAVDDAVSKFGELPT